MTGLLNDVRVTWRRLLKTPGFTLGAVLTLALGIGASTAVFAVVSGVLLRPLPFPNAERLVFITREGDASNPSMTNMPTWPAHAVKSWIRARAARYGRRASPIDIPAT